MPFFLFTLVAERHAAVDQCWGPSPAEAMMMTVIAKKLVSMVKENHRVRENPVGGESCQNGERELCASEVRPTGKPRRITMDKTGK